MNIHETEYLETLLPGFSVDQLSHGIRTALLLLPELEIQEALTVLLFYSAHCTDHAEDIFGHLLLKKSDLQAVADTCTHLSSILVQAQGTSGRPG